MGHKADNSLNINKPTTTLTLQIYNIYFNS